MSTVADQRMQSIPPRARTPRYPLTDVDETIRELRMRGMSARSIVIALDVFCGEQLSEGMVRYRCQQMCWSRGGVDHPQLGRPRKAAP